MVRHIAAVIAVAVTEVVVAATSKGNKPRRRKSKE